MGEKAESRKPKAETRKPKAETRKPKAENRKPKAENRNMLHRDVLPRSEGEREGKYDG